MSPPFRGSAPHRGEGVLMRGSTDKTHAKRLLQNPRSP